MNTLLPLGIPAPPEYLTHIGPVRTYALCILAGIFLAYFVTVKRYKARGGNPEIVMEVVSLAVLVGIIGARFYYVLTVPDRFFGPEGDLLAIFKIWEGGLGVMGGMTFGLIACFLYMKRLKLDTGVLIDAAVPGILIAQGVGRLGNYFNQELFGLPTSLPWALEVDGAHMPKAYEIGTTFHPTFLYEMLWNFAGALLLLWWDKRHRDTLKMWQLSFAYVSVYTIGRFAIENIRIDYSHYFLGLRVNAWFALGFMILGIIGYFWAGKGSRLSKAPDLDVSESLETKI
ncbi:MAG: prolipoprotein diacylglyceryl transferase [Actinomycetaceae bacterium]|nr:prolipoprotein diacylglyceryl transferase [Actinomycetaceae bacterium]